MFLLIKSSFAGNTYSLFENKEIADTELQNHINFLENSLGNEGSVSIYDPFYGISNEYSIKVEFIDNIQFKKYTFENKVVEINDIKK